MSELGAYITGFVPFTIAVALSSIPPDLSLERAATITLGLTGMGVPVAADDAKRNDPVR